MKLLALTFGDAHCASTQYRVTQYAGQLKERGIKLHLHPGNTFQDWASVPEYDAVLVQKKLFSLGRVRWLRRHARRIIYDLDDAIWLPHGRRHHWLTRWRTELRLAAIARAAHGCLVANGVLGARLRTWAKHVEIFPMTLDGAAWQPRLQTDDATVRLGWSGAPGNLRYLEALEPALLAVLQQQPQTRLVVLCGARPRFTRLAFEHLPWQPGGEPAAVATFDVGLLPLEPTPFAAGKSPIKGLQYLACGLLVVATPLAATRELFHGSDAARFASSPAEWAAELTALVADAALRQARGQAGRTLFEARYDLARQADVLHRMLATPLLSA